VDFTKVQEFKAGIVKKLTGGVASLLKANKVQYFQGEVMFINENEARVFNEQEAPRYRFKNCIIATGSRPIALKAFPFRGAERIVNRSAVAARNSEEPRRDRRRLYRRRAGPNVCALRDEGDDHRGRGYD